MPGNLVAVNVYHKRWVGSSLPLQHFSIMGSGNGGLESAREGREPSTGEGTASVGNDQSDIGKLKGVGRWAETTVYRLGFVVPTVAEGIGIVSGIWDGGVHQVYRLIMRGTAVFEKGVQLGPERQGVAETGERCSSEEAKRTRGGEGWSW